MTDFKEILESPEPGEALKRFEGKWPIFLRAGEEIPAGPLPWHASSVLGHLCRCMNAVAGDPVAVWMALAHDAGKLTTPAIMLPHHYGHEERGAALAEIWAEDLGLSEDYAEAGKISALWHMRAGRYPILRPGKKFKLLEAVQTQPFARSFWKVVDADTKSSISQFAFADWSAIKDAQARGLSRDMQMDLLCRLRSVDISNKKEDPA